jgi:hypothetical protein
VYGSEVLDDRLTNLDEAEISAGARAMLPLLEKFSLDHSGMADALRFEIGSQADFDKSTKSLLGRGYR